MASEASNAEAAVTSATRYVASCSCEIVRLPENSAHSIGRASPPPERVAHRMIAEWMDFLPREHRKQDHAPVAISTLFLLAEMPLGNRTFQRRSLWSTCKIRLATAGGWLTGDSTRTKSGPICVTERESPFTKRHMFTWAECPP
jgi:hypothetical protein